jgi:hypothetical protein
LGNHEHHDVEGRVMDTQKEKGVATAARDLFVEGATFGRSGADHYLLALKVVEAAEAINWDVEGIATQLPQLRLAVMAWKEAK